MSLIVYNSAIARLCGNNGIIKAVLLNYIYHFNKFKPLNGVGSPASISLAEFVYRYRYEDKPLWGRSFIHRILKDMCRDGQLLNQPKNNQPVYSVPNDIARLLNDKGTRLVSFDLEMACRCGIHIAIMTRYLLHVIDRSPKGEAYNLSVDDMAEVNGISPAQIYRVIKYLIDQKIVKRVKSNMKHCSRALSLARC